MSKSNDPDFLFIVKAITMSIVEWFFKLDPVLRSILIAISVALLVRAVNPNALTFVITISVIVVIFVAFFKEKDVQAKRWNAYLEAKDRLLE
jgi:cell division protein FtsW (lipid II flippase)